MPKIKVKPRASSAYCAPRLMPMRPVATKPCTECQLLTGRFDPHRRLLLAVRHKPDAEGERQFLVDAEELLPDPMAVPEVWIADGQRAQRFGNLCRIDRAGLGDRFDHHAS